MERFEGNGAECMVRFIADGCKGSIWLTAGELSGEVLNRYKSTTLPAWLFSGKCTYTPPETVWREVLQPKAYADCLADIQVQAQHASEPEEWYNVDLCDDLWKTRGIYRFRVRED